MIDDKTVVQKVSLRGSELNQEEETMADILQPEISSSFQLRDELEARVIKDLLGPAGGREEIVAEPTVRGRYILGLLAPKEQTAILAEEEDLDDQTDLPLAGEDTQDGSPDLAAACHACLFISETSCERGNRYLDRSVLVPTFAYDDLAFFDAT
jgi:hypothetical protein